MCSSAFSQTRNTFCPRSVSTRNAFACFSSHDASSTEPPISATSSSGVLDSCDLNEKRESCSRRKY